jgi:hypothetical protein
MAETLKPLPTRNPPKPQPRINLGAAVALLMLFSFALIPRLWILGFWIFSYGLDEAFGSWIIPAIGFFLAPWTTLLYTWMWAINSEAVAGWEWLLVGAGVLLDLLFIAIATRLVR